MLPAAVISKKRDQHPLSADEIREFIHGFTTGGVADYQMSALAMAICCRGMDAAETFALTTALLESGATLSRRPNSPPRVDKHSTGGIGDKVSLVLAPLLACCGLEVPMISGRGLGATGGTLDKLEAIPGFRTQLDETEFQRIAGDVGCVIAGATPSLVPADRKLYALRDVTGTVPSIPLITASIMSKKLAEGLDALVLDVKHGSGAFMKEQRDAEALARSMLAVGQQFGVKTSALLTDMNQPLGRMIGNANEVDESVAALEGRGPADLMEVTLALGARLLVDASMADNLEIASQLLQFHIDSGAGRAKFAEMIAAQGGNLDASRPLAPRKTVYSERGGRIVAVNTEALGLAVIQLGGGRRQQGDPIDHSVGLEMLVRIGDTVHAGEPLMHVFSSLAQFESVADEVRAAITIGDEPVTPPRLIQSL